MARIVISEFMDAAAVAALAASHDVRYDPALVDARDKLLAALADADALVVRNRTRVDAELLERAKALRVVGRLGVGLDNIDVARCRARAIDVIPATGANALAVAEYVIAVSMLLLRGAYASSAEVASGAWPRTRLSEGREIRGKCLGLVGYGGIGRLTAGLAAAIGMRVIAYDPALPAGHRGGGADAQQVTLDALLAAADVVSLHVPLIESTRHLIDAARLASMKKGAVLVNTARGGVVDETALAAALKNGHLGGAALDVFEDEPLKAGSPLAGAPNLVLTPHIAGLTAESNERVSTMIAERVAEALQREAVEKR